MSNQEKTSNVAITVNSESAKGVKYGIWGIISLIIGIFVMGKIFFCVSCIGYDA